MAEDLAQASAKAKHTSDNELKEWMARRRDQCKVLESVPGATTADFCSDPDIKSQSFSSQNRLSRATEPDTSSQEQQQKRVLASLARNDLRERLQQGPLSHSERMSLWPKLIDVGTDFPSPEDANAFIPQAISDLLQAETNDEQVLFECDDGGEDDEEVNHLVVAFCRRYLRCFDVPTLESGREGEIFSFDAISQLLLYHFPASAVAMRSVAIAEKGANDLAGLLRSVCTSCGMEVPVRDLLFETSHGDSSRDFTEENASMSALRLFCDLIVTEDDDLLIVFAMVMLLSEISPEPGCAFAYLEENLQQAVTLGALAGRSVSEVVSCVTKALELLRATPQSLKSVIRGERRTAWLQSPICLVSPEEVLQHTHLGVSCAWRLIVVDARMRASECSLPVCVRLPPARHSCRLEELQKLPQDEVVHLCLMGDGPPGRSDDALELCLCLVGKGSLWKHVSIVEGGWPSVEQVAGSMGLEIMPNEKRTDSETSTFGTSVVEQVSVAKETASTAAQLALSGASRALSYLDEKWGSTGQESDELHSPQELPQASEREGQRQNLATSLAASTFGYFGGLLARGKSSNEESQDSPTSAAPTSSGTQANRALSYLDGFWGGGKTPQQQETPPVDDSEPEGPRFSGVG